MAQTASPEKYLLSTREAAAYLGVRVESIREWTNRNFNPLPAIYLPGSQWPRYTKEALETYANSFVRPKA